MGILLVYPFSLNIHSCTQVFVNHTADDQDYKGGDTLYETCYEGVNGFLVLPYSLKEL